MSALYSILDFLKGNVLFYIGLQHFVQLMVLDIKYGLSSSILHQ